MESKNEKGRKCFFFPFSWGNCYSKRFNFASVDLKLDEKYRSTSPENQKMKIDLQLAHKHRLVLRVRSTHFFVSCSLCFPCLLQLKQRNDMNLGITLTTGHSVSSSLQPQFQSESEGEVFVMNNVQKTLLLQPVSWRFECCLETLCDRYIICQECHCVNESITRENLSIVVQFLYIIKCNESA